VVVAGVEAEVEVVVSAQWGECCGAPSCLAVPLDSGEKG